MLRDRVDFGVERIVLDGFPDQAPFGGLFRRQRLAGEREAERARLPDEPRQGPGAAAVGNQADRREALDELRRFRGDDDVAGERDVRAGARGDAVDARDHRLREARSACGSAGSSSVSTVSPRSTASPGATARSLRSCPAQKPRPAPVSTTTRASPRFAKRVAQLLVHLRGEAVEPVGAVERDPGDRPVRLEVDGLVSHAARLAKEGAWTQTNSRTVSRTHMLAGEGTGPAWGSGSRKRAQDYARVSMVVRADMLNSHGIRAWRDDLRARRHAPSPMSATAPTKRAWRRRRRSSSSTRSRRARP